MIIYHSFEWDVREAARNMAQHGVSFKEASTVFADESCAVVPEEGARLRATGRSDRGRPLVVLHEAGPRVRILSAAVLSPKTESAAPKAQSVPPKEELPAPQIAVPQIPEPAPVVEPQAAKADVAARKSESPAPKSESRARKTVPPALKNDKPAPSRDVRQSLPRDIRREPRPGSWRAAARALSERLALESAAAVKADGPSST